MKPGSVAHQLFHKLRAKALEADDFDWVTEEWDQLETILKKAASGIVPPVELFE